MFSNKRIKVEVVLSNKYDILGSTQNLVFEDFKIDVMAKRVENAIGPTASIKIYGVSKEYMDSITTLLFRDTIEIEDKRVIVWVDNGTGYFKLFEGWITEAVPVYRSAPDCYIQIESSMAAYENNMKLPPISFENESVAISSICDAVCAAYGVKSYTSDLVKIQPNVNGKKLRLGSNNEGLNVRVGQLCEAYGLRAFRVIDGYKFFMKSEKGDETLFIFTPETIIGYPSYKNKLIQVETEDFNSIELNNQFKITGSEIPYANGLWYVSIIEYVLQSWTPNGKWQAIIYGGPVGGSK